MNLKGFQEWTREFDATTGWELLAYLAEEVGALIETGP